MPVSRGHEGIVRTEVFRSRGGQLSSRNTAHLTAVLGVAIANIVIASPAFAEGGDAAKPAAAKSDAANPERRSPARPSLWRGSSAMRTNAPQGLDASPAASNAVPERFDIDEFRVDGADKLPQIDVEEAVYPFLGPNKNSGDVEKARAALEKSYHDRGLQTVSVAIPSRMSQAASLS